LLTGRVVFGANPIGVGDRWVVDTSVPDTLQSQIIQISADLAAAGRLQYEIGFSTRDTVDLGVLFDSLTIALARGDGSSAANLVTADVFGLTIAPLSPTGLLANGGITAQETSLQITPLDNATMSYAYVVDVALPPSLVGTDLRTTFSFFNNGDSTPSVGYASVIPEPPPSVLIVFVGAILWVYRKRTART
jgi:hypothetical protein